MAGRESAGAVVVTITGDSSPLMAAYARAESESRSAGQKIGNALVSPIVTESGRAQAAVTDISGALIKDLVPAARAATVAAEKTAVAIKAVGDAASHSIPPVAALGGEIRVISGEQSIRAVERFGVSVLGLGAAAQAVFPLFGAIAVGELFTRVYERVAKVTEGETAAAEQAKRLVDEIRHINEETAKINVDTFAKIIGKTAAGAVSVADIQAQITAQTNLIALQDRQLAAQKVAVSHGIGLAEPGIVAEPPRFGATPEQENSLISLTAAKADIKEREQLRAKADSDLANMRAKLHAANVEFNLSQGKDNKTGTEEAKKDLDAARSAFKDKYDNQLADLKAAHEVSHAEELRFRQEELADKRIGGLGGADGNPVLREVKNQVGTLSQDVDRDNTAEAKKQAEAQKKIREDAIRDLAEDGRLRDEQVRANATAAREAESEATRQSGIRQRTGQLAIQGQGVRAESANEADKLREQQQYSLQIVHSRQDQVVEARKLADFDEKALQIKISIAQLETIGAILEQNRVPTKEGELKIAEDELKIEQAKAALLKQQIEDATKLGVLKKSGTIGAALAQQGSRIPQALGSSLASGIIDGKGIGRDIRQSLSGIGKEMLGTVFDRLITQIAAQTGVTAALNAMLGIHTGVVAANTGATVGSTLSTLANTISTDLNTFWLEIKAALSFFGFASGGRPQPGVPYMVGENGPELRIDDGPGVIIPNHVAFGGGISSPILTASMVSNSASSAFSIGAIHLHGIQNAEQFARMLPNVLKSRAPNFSPATR